MASSPAEIWLRMGTHSEKEYVLKLGRFFSGLMFGANLVESTPAASASLVVGICGEGTKTPIKHLVDPMTYAYGAYIDRTTSEPRQDLDWLKSNQKIKGSKKTERRFKRSYRSLAAAYGGPFQDALVKSTALNPESVISHPEVEDSVRRILDYQISRMRHELEQDEGTKELADSFPSPATILAPYFYCDPEHFSGWIDANIQLAGFASQHTSPETLGVVICADEGVLRDGALVKTLVERFGKCDASEVWLWLSRFDESKASVRTLVGFRELISGLHARGKRVFNLHGGYFSLLMSKFGLAGTAHGVGYGEQKDVVPVVGQSTPWVAYYLPAVHGKAAVREIEVSFHDVGVRTVEDFYRKICGCAICKGVVSTNLGSFGDFGEVHLSHPAAKRVAQTPAAAKKCRYHYLLARVKEGHFVAKSDIDSLVRDLEHAHATWEPSALPAGSYSQLATWIASLQA